MKTVTKKSIYLMLGRLKSLMCRLDWESLEQSDQEYIYAGLRHIKDTLEIAHKRGLI